MNGGRYSKFQERLKRIVRNRFKRKKRGIQEEEQRQFINDKVKEIHEVVSRDTKVNRNVNVKNVYVSKKVVNNRAEKSSSMVKNDKTTAFLGDRITIVKGIDNKARIKNNYSKGKKIDSKDDLELFGVEIISKIRDNFIDKLDELEVLESELYLLSVEERDALELKRLKELEKKIRDIIKEVNEIIDQYNLYNKNYYMDNFIGLEDRFIVDDILNYRDLLNSSDKEKKFVKEYKLLDEFKGLYNKLVEVKHDTEVLRDDTEEKRKEFDIRDKKYENIVKETIRINDVEKECIDKINKQNKYLSDLTSKINVIDKNEYVTSHLRGLGDLIETSFKFIGLKLLSPLSGLIPSIAVNTLMTKKMIGEMYKNLHYEDIKHVYYSAIDYDREILGKIVDVGYTESLIDNTLGDVKKLREDFMKQYDSNIAGYSDTLKRINDIELNICRNQNKISIIKKRLIENKKINENKMVKVKKMNENKF